MLIGVETKTLSTFSAGRNPNVYTSLLVDSRKVGFSIWVNKRGALIFLGSDSVVEEEEPGVEEVEN